MRWAFWRRGARDEAGQPPRPLPSSSGLPAGAAAAPRSAPQAPGPPDDEPRAAIPAGSRPSPSAEVPDLPAGPVPQPVARAGLDPSQLPAVRSALVGLVRDVLAGRAASAGPSGTAPPAGDGPAGGRSATPPDRTTLVADAALAVLAARLPTLSGVTGSVHDDPDALRLQLAYADVLAGRADRLRRTAAAHLTPDAVRQTAREAAGEPGTADPRPAALDPATRLAAAAVLLAQTCLDGGGTVEALAAEVTALAGP